MLPAHDPSAGLPHLSLRRCLRGLRRTEVMTDLWTDGPFTLVAPVDAAFDRLPGGFERLLHDAGLIESCIDLFEYLVVRGHCAGDGSSRSWRTLHGEDIEIGEGVVTGSVGRGRILASVGVHDLRVLAVDGWVSPRSLFRDVLHR